MKTCRMISDAVVLGLFLISTAMGAEKTKTMLPDQKTTIDFSRSAVNLYKKENAHWMTQLKQVATDFAKEGTVYSKPLEFDSLNLVMNPVLEPKEFKYFFKFNLKATDGRQFNCHGLIDEKLENKRLGCFLAVQE